MSDSRRVTLNGIEFNGPVVDGVEFEITAVTGLGEPAPVYNSEPNTAADGESATSAFRGARAIGIEGVVRADSEVAAELAWNQLRRAVDLAEFPITFHYASGPFTVWVRRDGELTPDSRDLPTEFPFKAVLKAIDPRLFVGLPGDEMVMSTGLPHSSGGLTFPITFPVTFSGASATGDLSVVLEAGGKMSMRIAGPVVNPSVVVENDEGFYRLAWLETIEAGMWLDVDPEPTVRSVLLQGQASRPPAVRKWPRLAAGVNTIRFRADDYDPSALLTVTVRPTL